MVMKFFTWNDVHF